MLYFNTNKPHSFFFRRIPAVLENRRSSQGGGCAPPAPPSRSAPEQGKAEQTASCSGRRRRRRGCPFLILNSATPIQLRFKELCGGFYTKLRSPSKRISVFHCSNFYRCKLNVGSISRCTFQIFHGNVKIVQNERKRRIVIDTDEDD